MFFRKIASSQEFCWNVHSKNYGLHTSKDVDYQSSLVNTQKRYICEFANKKSGFFKLRRRASAVRVEQNTYFLKLIG